MKRLMLVTLLGVMLASGTGCCIIDRLFHCPCGRWRGGGCGPHSDACAPCGGCADLNCPYGNGYGEMHGGGVIDGGHMPGGCKDCHLGRHLHGPGAALAGPQGPPGPAVGQVAYPYYTTRGPRDFLAANPPDIGP